jgi:hypothetical protein
MDYTNYYQTKEMLKLKWFEGDELGHIISTHLIPKAYIIRIIQDTTGKLVEMEVINITDEYLRAS